MKQFMNDDFLLETKTAQQLYHNCASKLPIIDYHCHVEIKEIFEDKYFDNLTEIWLGGKQQDGLLQGDHYKWRLMRQYGIEESYITGNCDPFERLKKFTQVLEIAINNPIHHWCNLELKKYFGITEELTSKNINYVWEETNRLLKNKKKYSARSIISSSNVEYIGTTDDPIDSLEYHIKLFNDKSFNCRVAPSFRADNVLQIQNENFCEYIKKLANSVGENFLSNINDVCAALEKRLDFFIANGCGISDHGLETISFCKVSMNEANTIFQKRMNGQKISLEDINSYQTYMLLFLGKIYHRHNIVMQLHLNCLRNVNARQYIAMGADSGHDIIGKYSYIKELAKLISELDISNECPKIILYSLDQNDYAQLSTLAGSFYETNVRGKIQHGSAWWFNDTKSGIENHLQCLSNLGLLANSIGMLTDSRSFLSYARHEYFRRILCNFIGNLVESGQFPNDFERLKSITENICYYNAKSFFNLQKQN